MPAKKEVVKKAAAKAAKAPVKKIDIKAKKPAIVIVAKVAKKKKK